MGTNRKAPLAIPILIIFVGIGWLLTAQGIVPAVNWLWSLSLGGIGILTFVLSGVDKASIVVGPFFLLASLLSVLRQTGQLRLDVEVPILVIGVGIFLLIAQIAAIRNPTWFAPPAPTPADGSGQSKKLRL